MIMPQLRWDKPLWFRGPVDAPDGQWLHNQAKSQAGQDLFVVAMTQGKTQGTWLELGCGHPLGSNNTYLLEKRLDWSGVSIDTQDMGHDIITPFEEYWHGFYRGIRRPDWPEQPIPFDQLPKDAHDRFYQYYINFIARQKTDIDDIPGNLRTWTSCRPRTQFYQQNAFDFDYSKLPYRMDYLQVDLHPSTANLEILDQVLSNHRFSVITFEHDFWDHSVESAHVRQQSRKVLQDCGYDLVISDATVPPGHGNGIGDEPINFEDWWADPEIIGTEIRECYRDIQGHGSPKYYYHTLFQGQQ